MTMVSIDDIDNLMFQSYTNGTGSGSFSVEMSYGLSATFLFTTQGSNDNLRVTQLAVKHKLSSDIKDGHLIARVKDP